ncbi:hypothetical protein ACH4D5_29310 [Streptomyces sp. NPDC018029]|uniref:hypothetical protein n=1 Tax=Streptomyces sp. NPDC018029 TaxID=3365032 RepID=UPI0037B73D13
MELARSVVFSVASALLAVAGYHFAFGSTASWDVRAVAATVLFCAGQVAASWWSEPTHGADAPFAGILRGAWREGRDEAPYDTRRDSRREARRDTRRADRREAQLDVQRNSPRDAQRYTRHDAQHDIPRNIRHSAEREPQHEARREAIPRSARREPAHRRSRHGLQHGALHKAQPRAPRRPTAAPVRRLAQMLRLLWAFLVRLLRPFRAPVPAALPLPAPVPRAGRPVRAPSLPLLLADAVVRRGPPVRPPLAVV